MQNTAIWKKTIYDGLWLFIACALFCLAFSWMRVWIVSQLDTERFRQIIELLPGDWRKFSPADFDWLMSYAGRVVLNYDEPMLIMVLAVWCISRGSDCVSGELGRGTLEMTLAQPVSRRKLFFVQGFVTVMGVALLAVISWIGVWGGIMTSTITEITYPEIKVPLWGERIAIPFLPPNENTMPMSERLNAIVFWPAVLCFFCLGVFLSGMAAMLSAFDRYRWRTIGIAASIFVIASMIKILGLAVSSFEWTLWLSFFTCYEPETAVQMMETDPYQLLQFTASTPDRFMFGQLTYLIFFVGLGLLFFLIGGWYFERRDLPAPL